MSILQNAVDSIALGLDDYMSPDDRRILSSTRNLFAGILLLFKHKLSILSPPNSNEVLIKKRMVATKTSSGTIEFIGEGKATVDVAEIKARLDGLKIAVDWKRVEAIQRFRNEIEHYHSSKLKADRSKVVSDSFIVIRDFIYSHLNEEPRVLLGDKSWQILLSENQVYEAEKKPCDASMRKVEWKSECLLNAFLYCTCQECDSGLIFIEKPETDRETNIFKCKSCGHIYKFEEMATAALAESYDASDHRSVKDGGEPEIIKCPECHKYSYVLSEKQCAICLAEIEHECQRCGLDIPTEELTLSEGYCGWCAHMMSKDD